MKKLFICFCIILFINSCASSSQGVNKDITSINVINISEAKKQSKEFSIAAFVISAYKCPLCSDGDMCKPCIGNHIMVSDIKPDGTNTVSFENQIRVFV